jgi:geranylgeranyl diphosphate synthase type II
MIDSDQHGALLKEARDAIEAGLDSIELPEQPASLYEPVRYALSSKGKRIRPVLTVLAGQLFGADPKGALNAALAVEIFHTFTLVHDDIMDKSDTRRGRETIHVKWDEPTAILVGDMLLGITPGLLAKTAPERLADIIEQQSDTVRILCEGQILDMAFESRRDVSVEEYLDMIDRKTGFLLQTSLVYGGLFGNASTDDLKLLSDLGYHLGRAFQIQDDLLDVVSTSTSWGKPVGGDLLAGKMTYLLTSVLQVSDNPFYDWWYSVVAAGKLERSELELASTRLQEAGIIHRAQEAVIFHFEKVDTIVESLPANAASNALASLIALLRNRTH